MKRLHGQGEPFAIITHEKQLTGPMGRGTMKLDLRTGITPPPRPARPSSVVRMLPIVHVPSLARPPGVYQRGGA